MQNKKVEQIEKDDNEEYDPHMHRNVEHATTNIETFVHILKSMLGTGILAMPRAFYHAGFVVGFIFTPLIGILVTYCTHVLIRCQYILCKRHREPSLTYKVTMRRALEGGPPFFRRVAPFAGRLVNGFMLVYQLGACTVYVIFIADNLRTAFEEYWNVHIRYYILLSLIPLILITCVRHLKYLAPFSTFGNLCILVGIILILVYIFKPGGDLAISKIETAGKIADFPLYFGTVLFALVCVNVILTVESKMKTPKTFVSPFGVLNCALGMSTILYTIFGFLGYLKFRDAIRDTITVNLPASEIMVKVTQVLFAFDIFISFGIQIYVAFEIIWKLWSTHFSDDWSREYVLRILLALIPFALAVAFQEMGLFISLFGALCLSTLGLAFPAIIEICVLYPHFGRFNYVLVRNILIMIISIFALVAGVVKSIIDIVAAFNKSN